jgi:hypothetical protein
MLQRHAGDLAGCIHSHAKPPVDESSAFARTAVSCFLNDAVRLVLCLSVVTVCPPESQSLCLVICVIPELYGIPLLCAVANMLQHFAHTHVPSKLGNAFIVPHPKDVLIQAASTTDLPALNDLKAEHEACLAAVEHIFKTANVELEAGSVDTTFRCPITEEIFRDPVLAPSGTSFERSAIQLWLVVINCVLHS